MKKPITLLIAAICVSVAIALMVSAVSAQGRYSARYSNRDVSNIIQSLETSSNRFTLDFDREMDRSPMNGTAAEDRFNANVRDYANALDRLRRNFDQNRSWWSSRNNVQDVINRAQPVNEMMNSISFRRNIERQWTAMRNDLNRLADTFDLPGLAGGGWTGERPTGPRGNIPNWARGTFYGRNPQTGGSIAMTIDRSGDVSISFDGGAPIYASMNGTTLRNGQYTSRVSRITNGIRTTDVENGSYIDYFTTPNYGGGYYPPPSGGGNVPSWAVGTFQARNPENGGNITMTIDANGSVTLSYDNGAPSYASLNGTTLRNGPYTSRISQTRNGIRTTDVNNGNYIDYTRSSYNPGGGGYYPQPGGNVPNWAIGTFRARNPESGGTIIMTINRNGSVTIVFDNGSPTYATLNGTTLTNGPYVSRISEIRNGIRTTDVNNGSFIDYRRQ